jgi:trimethylamine--corrinoid protein Co-methyltransferase
VSAVRPGLPGGTYRSLSDRDIERIHATALDVLEKLGVGEPIPEILDVALPPGDVGGTTRVGFVSRDRWPRTSSAAPAGATPPTA